MFRLSLPMYLGQHNQF